MKNNLKKQQSGFTIIEVLIVLAIAGLIMLIVFLAVPALQRNSRNTSIRNDVGNILSGVGEFVSNNNGQLPTTVACAPDGTVTLSGASTTQPNTTKVRPQTTCAAATTFPGGIGAINVAFNNKCNGNTGITPSVRSYAALFRVESGSSTNPTQCVES
jgi:prepilin-type N-terminal cleavage/methylation domain-containing protein